MLILQQTEAFDDHTSEKFYVDTFKCKKIEINATSLLNDFQWIYIITYEKCISKNNINRDTQWIMI